MPTDKPRSVEILKGGLTSAQDFQKLTSAVMEDLGAGRLTARRAQTILKRGREQSTRQERPEIRPAAEHETQAAVTLGENLEGISHMVSFGSREMEAIFDAAARATTAVGAELGGKEQISKMSPERASSAAVTISETVTTLIGSLAEGTARFHTATLWQTVMLVTCVEAYLQDLLASAARIDPEFMRDSTQAALYEEVLAAGSLEELAESLRARWARNWVDDGGPTRWISRLTNMQRPGYPEDLAPRLERIWGIRHVAVHRAGRANAEFMKRHPGVVKRLGDRVTVSNEDYKSFLKSVYEFIDPTERSFIGRFPRLAAPKNEIGEGK